MPCACVKDTRVNNKILLHFFQSCQFILYLLFAPILVSSIVMKNSVKEMYGDTTCWILAIATSCRGIKQILGGFFMAVYRIICLKRSDIAMNFQSQRGITHRLIVLEWIVMFLLVGFQSFGIVLSGTSPAMSFFR